MSADAKPDVQARADTGKPALSVLVPTLNEVDNIDPLLTEVLEALDKAGVDAEIVIADGGSKDGTQEKVRAWESRGPVRLAQSDAKRGLAGDIMYGARQAKADVVLVMDADLSHPTESVPAVAKPVLDGTHEMAIGSRYVPGGDTPGWPWHRRLTSRTATLIAWPLVSVNDPMAGFFAVRKEYLLALGQEAAGFKIAMEIVARGDDDMRVAEVPIVFKDRIHGESKLGLREFWSYLRQVAVLAGGSVSSSNLMKFIIVGLLGVLVDGAFARLCLVMGTGIVAAQMISFVLATIFNYELDSRWAFAEAVKQSDQPAWQRYVRFMIICLLALFLRGGVIDTCQSLWALPDWLAIVPGLIVGALVNYVGFAFFVFPQQGIVRTTPSIRWRVLSICVVGYILALRLAFYNAINLLPEEAYYWLYSWHLDYGYYDHPPMVAWLIRGSTTVLGKNAMAVRMVSFVCWLIAAGYMFALTRNLVGKTAAFRSAILMAVLPIYTLWLGMFTSPDAPMYACWCACLYYIERALFTKRFSWWLGVGITAGLGMLSKYAIAFLGPATALYMLLDRDTRKLLLSPGPYVAALLTLAIFSPVIWWNANHDWVSFLFHLKHRWPAEHKFSLHIFIAACMLLLTPVGFIGVIKDLLPRAWGGPALPATEVTPSRRRLFAVLMTLVPLAVFVWSSLKYPPKLNWAGGPWLGIIPIMAWDMAPVKGEQLAGLAKLGRHIWKPTIVVLLLLYGGALYYISQEMPGAMTLEAKSKQLVNDWRGKQSDEPDYRAWPFAWQEVAEIAHRGRLANANARTGRLPVIVGMNRYFTSAASAFYDGADRQGPVQVAGRHLVTDDEAVMLWFWHPAKEYLGRDLLLIDFDPGEIAEEKIGMHFQSLGPVHAEPVIFGGRPVATVYWRIGRHYQPDPSLKALATQPEGGR